MANALVIDNSPLLQRILAQTLWATHDVSTASNWTQASELLKKNTPELIMVANVLEGKSGYDICQELRNTPATKTARIIMMSSLSEENDIARGFKAGIDEYIVKPFTPEQILEKVKLVSDPNYLRKPRRQEKILVIDDSPLVRNMLENDLSQAGFKVVSAVDGKDGLEKVYTHKPDLITTDLEMPNMNGYEFARTVRQNPQIADIPIIMITSRIDQESRSLGFDAGVVEYFVKPIESDILIRCINHIIDNMAVKRQRSVLLIEDSPTTRHFVKYSLQKHGWDTVHLNSPENAIATLREKHIDLVLLDITYTTSNITGFDLLREIRSIAEFAAIPIMLISFTNTEESINMGFELGADDYLVKPFSIKELIYRAKVHLHATNRLKDLEKKGGATPAGIHQTMSALSEELRAPIASILGFADMLKEDASLSSKQKECVEGIKKACKSQVESISKHLQSN